MGCAKLPNSPIVDSTTASAPVAHTQQEGLIGGVVDVLKGLLVKTLNLVGSLGGSLTNGRWKVVVPANAVDGNATISLGVVTTASPGCQLEITPADRNHFRVPVTLTIDCSGIPDTMLRNYVILWWDPARSVWVPVDGSKVDLINKTVSAPLSHFSSYSVGYRSGKAGW